VQGPRGVPLLVNARARQLLGQREEMSAGVAHLSQVYRLHRPDGSPYPAEELPVSRALLSGTTCTASDVVVHRPDGRKVALMCWAAPIDLGGQGRAEAAVWVMEDFTVLRRAESESRESEQRMRAVVDAMVDGVIVLNADGAPIDANPAACSLLGVSREVLLSQKDPFIGLFGEDGKTESPTAAASRFATALRGEAPPISILGLRRSPDGPVRWLRVNATALPVGPLLAINRTRARVVVTFNECTTSPSDLRSLLSAIEAVALKDEAADLQRQIVDLGRQLLVQIKNSDAPATLIR
jgi:PAS domain S-box-containing protein